MLTHPTVSLPKRKPESHKGNYGRLFVLAGSEGMTGAAYLTAESAVRGGAGLVTLGIPRSLNPILEVKTTCAMTLPLPEKDGAFSADSLEIILNLMKKSTAMAVGPGITTLPQVRQLVETLLQKTEIPLVIDADGLNCMEGKKEIWSFCKGRAILTPHVGEFARISGFSKEDILSHPLQRGKEFAQSTGVVLLLKGHHTLVIEGEKVYQNQTGNPGMATGGSGDVLTGLIGAFLAQGLSPFESGMLGAYIHGRAGDLAAQELGQIGLSAMDILHYLPFALKEYHGF